MDDNPLPPHQGHVLIIEDDPRLAALIVEFLSNNGFRVTHEDDGALGVERILTLQPDLVILDRMLPGEDGLSIFRRVRDKYAGPILMHTARTDDMDQVLGLEMGADAYVPKPAQPRVLLSRIRALLRRIGKRKASNKPRLTFGTMVIDNTRREVWRDGERVNLSSAEYDLLWLLASNAGRTLTREEIFSQLHGIEYDGQGRSVDVRVARIRSKIDNEPNQPRRLKTVRSKGYIFMNEVDHLSRAT